MTKRCVFVLAAAWLVGAGPAQASVERIPVQSREPFHTGVAGPYVKVTGTFTGSLDPRTEPIPGIERAPVRADERVEYASDFIVLFAARLIPSAPSACGRWPDCNP